MKARAGSWQLAHARDLSAESKESKKSVRPRATFAGVNGLSSGTRVYAPVKDEEKKREKGEDPFERRKGDSDEVATWRRRMGTESAKEIYKQRAATAEFPNAGCRNRGLLQFLVRGRLKTKAVSLWQALAHNFQRTLSLRAAAGLDMV